MIKEDGVVFFFHLLGIDTHGHSKKPHSMYFYKYQRLLIKKFFF